MARMDDLEYRPLREDEFAAAVELDSIAFAEQHTAEDAAFFRQAFEFERSFCAFADGRLVGITSALSLELTLPGGRLLPVSGVTWVMVLPTHKRLGILTRLMRFQLEDATRRGEAAAVLIASEGGIYGRFGLGPATSFKTFTVARARGAFRSAVSQKGHLEMFSAAQAREHLPIIFDRVRRTQPGEVSRPTAAWLVHLHDAEHGDAGPMHHVGHRAEDGRYDGYASYRVKEQWTGWLAANEVRLVELMAADPQVYAALWEYLLTLDLTGGVTCETGRVDEPLRWLLADLRALQVQAMSDYLWLRLLDLPKALAARTYGARGDVVVEVLESFPLIRRSRWLLSVAEPGGPARCEPTGLPAQLQFNVSTLSAAYLGGVPFAALAAAGRLVSKQPGAVERADAMFVTAPSPHCVTMF